RQARAVLRMPDGRGASNRGCTNRVRVRCRAPDGHTRRERLPTRGFPRCYSRTRVRGTETLMAAPDPAAFAAFLERNVARLNRIVYYSCRQWAKGDVEGEAYLAAVDLGEKRGSALELHDPQDEELLLRC